MFIMFGISLCFVFLLYFSSSFAQSCSSQPPITNINPIFSESIGNDGKLLVIKKCLSNLEKCTTGIQFKDVAKANASCLSLGTNRSYVLTSTSSTWNKTREECQKMGGDLATVGIRSCTSRKLIISFARDLKLLEKKLWLGLSKVNKSWQWLDGVKEPDNSSFWDVGEPNNQGWDENCATLLLLPRKLNDLACTKHRFGLCELKKTSC